MSVPFIQTDFSGGINLFDEDSSLAENEYRLGFNIRNRNGDISLIKESEILANAPAGLKQGLYGFGEFLVLFNSGLAYYSTDDGDSWTQIADFVMSSTAPRLYAQAVPASTLNFSRQLQAAYVANGSGSDTRVDTLSNIVISGNESGLIVQDGINQPWAIRSDGTAFETQTYAEWTQAGDRSYVPIGLNMAFINGILFVISPTRKKLYRSVSGRPIDFVVNVTVTGDKGGDADTTAYTPTFNDINSITALKTGQLLIGTKDGCFPLILNYDRTLFQEPTFLNPTTYLIGIVNQFAIVETLEDYYLIDFDGIRSLNALLAEENEGRNTDFTRKISSLFDDVRQTDSCAAFKFDNFSIFGCGTIYGNVALVYDTKKSSWSSVDFLTIGAIKQFASVREADDPKLFCIDAENVYKLYDGEEYAQGVVSTRTVKSGDAKIELKLSSVRPIFDRSDSISELRVTEYVNGRRGKGVAVILPENLGGVEYPAEYPVAFDSANFIDNLNVPFDKISNQGYKVGCSLTWNNGARLTHLQFDCDSLTAQTALKQRSKTRANP